MSKSKILLFSSISFILGIAFSEFLAVPFFIVYTIFILTVVTLFLKNKKRFLLFFLLFFLAGILRFDFSRPKEINVEEKIIFNGIIIEEVEDRNDYQNLVVQDEIGRRALVRVNSYPKYFFGESLKINCKPKAIDLESSYGRYLTKNKINYICYYPKIEVLSSVSGNTVYSQILKFKQNGKEIINKNVPSPEAEILGAMLLGYKKEIPQEWRGRFSIAGISHIVAISGMHLVIISIILMIGLIRVGLWRQQAFYATIIFLWLYITMIAYPASAVRAGIMISLVLWAQHLGRARNVISVIFFAAAILLLVNPLFLLSDIGFQLSFLAVLGIIYLTPIFSFWFRKVPDFWDLKKILLVTLSAQIVTLPLSVYYFEIIPLLALPINLIIIPLLPIIFILGMLIIFTGFFWSSVSIFIGYLVWAILNIVLKIVLAISSLKFSSFQVEEINLFWIFGVYAILIFAVYKIKKKQDFEIMME
ncbi:ComEC/Rec2 family competence protein [Candidatus Falkowbacteria bacterium]|jgi:competence protein ComEC|nr:ComEC/Rec2 family competence protein [Candidatus Falkowbacteria bacterium]MBT4432728.1 ComEC/Rec2 family competence protein [Candidatus Falkowbacteria bacterium]